MTKAFYRWFLFFTTTIFIILASLYLGVFGLIVAHQVTLWSMTILFSVYCVSSSVLGYKIYKQDSDTETIWFSADQIMTLGLIGTVIGLIMVFQSFQNLDPSNVTQMVKMVKEITYGIFVAFFTTLGGFTFQMFLKVQLEIFENFLRKLPVNER